MTKDFYEYRIESQLGVEYTRDPGWAVQLIMDPHLRIKKVEVIHRDGQGRIIYRGPWGCSKAEED